MTDIKTVIVTGCPRGGTTAYARVINALGIPFITTRPLPKSRDMEYKPMSDHLQAGEWAKAQSISDDINFRLESAYREKKVDEASRPSCSTSSEKFVPRWGFKTPGVLGALDEILLRFCDPFVVYVLRDPFATALSVKNRHGEGYSGRTLRLVSEEQQRACILLPDRLPDRHVFVSFERLLTRTRPVVSDLCDTLCIRPDDWETNKEFNQRFNTAVDEVRLDDFRYNASLECPQCGTQVSGFASLCSDCAAAGTETVVRGTFDQVEQFADA